MNIHQIRKLLYDFSVYDRKEDHYTMGMINGFLIKQGLMEPCTHPNVKKVIRDSPQGMRHGLECPDCDESVYFAIGVTEGTLW